MMSNWKNRAATLLLCLPLAVAGRALGQSASPAAERHAQLQQGQDRLIEMFLDQATSELNLSVAQRDGLEDVLRETMERRSELARQQQRLHRQIRDALSDPTTQDDEFHRLSGEILATRRQETALLEWQEGRLGEVLTPRQTLRFMLMQQQLAQRIEEMRRKRQGAARQGQRR